MRKYLSNEDTLYMLKDKCFESNVQNTCLFMWDKLVEIKIN